MGGSNFKTLSKYVILNKKRMTLFDGSILLAVLHYTKFHPRKPLAPELRGTYRNLGGIPKKFNIHPRLQFKILTRSYTAVGETGRASQQARPVLAMPDCSRRGEERDGPVSAATIKGSALVTPAKHYQCVSRRRLRPTKWNDLAISLIIIMPCTADRRICISYVLKKMLRDWFWRWSKQGRQPPWTTRLF